MRLDHILDALRDPKYYILMVFVIAQSITNAGITNFNPLIISGYGFSTAKTTLMATPQAAVAMVAQTVFTAIAFFVPNVRCLLWVVSSLVALAGAVMVHVLDASTQRNASLAGLYLMGFYNTPWVLALSLQTSNTGGTTKKSFVSISVAVFYGNFAVALFSHMLFWISADISVLAVGNIIGPQFFRGDQAPKYALGIGAMLCCFAIMAATAVLYFLICFVSNKHRDRIYGPVDESSGGVSAGIAADAEDLTDLKNTNFRYIY